MKHLAVLVVALAAVPAFAHIHITSPASRYASNGLDGLNKHCPCGSGPGDQYCGGGVTSDDNRSANVTTFAPGQTITVRFTEDIAHSGRFRVAFDDDGADLADFNAHILADFPDPSGSAGADCTVGASATDVTCTPSGNSDWSVTLTLPSTPCASCTLQVIQDMNGDTVDAVPDPSGDRTYYQCSDIVLGAEGEGEGEGAAEGEGEGEGEGEAPPSSTGCSAAGAPGALALALAALALRRRRPSTR